MDMTKKMNELITQLNNASQAYYAKNTDVMSDREYDALYDQLQQLEAECGTILANSPSIKVGYEAVDELPKEKHEKPMLSLGKTKEREELQEWLKEKSGLLSWKLDGLTVVLTYQNGELSKAVTRGNGEIGEVVTNNAKVFENLPKRIAFQGELILRGEAVITYSAFEQINREIEGIDAKYKNPRNLCSGSVRQLNNEVTASRHVKFFAFALVKAEGEDFHDSREAQFLFLQKLGFDIVAYQKVTAETILSAVDSYEKAIAGYDIPSDGLVLIYEDISYGLSLGATAKFPRDAIAFKWTDEIRETNLKEIEWSPSRTGLINPVAIFEPVELEGTTVSRASVHNISILRGLKLGIGDRITVYKANMIIPQIAENLTGSDTVEVPATCPACGEETEIRQVNEVQALYCKNPDCSAKKIKAFSLFVSRNALNIEGLSEATLEKLIGKGFIHQFTDIFHLSRYQTEIMEMEGFGQKSYQNLIDSIEKSRNTTLSRLLYGLGIANIGVANAKMICKALQHDIARIRNVSLEKLSQIDGIGEVIATAYTEYFADASRQQMLDQLLEELQFEEESIEEVQTLAGKVFVITGDLIHYENRDALKEQIEIRGGKVTGSVTRKTDCLINNDNLSQSSKNKKAKELAIPVLTEEEFIQLYLQNASV